MGMGDFLWSIAIQKGVKQLIQLVLAWATAHGIGQFGISIDEPKLTAGIFAVLEVLRNWLKQKKGIRWL